VAHANSTLNTVHSGRVETIDASYAMSDFNVVPSSCYFWSELGILFNLLLSFVF